MTNEADNSWIFLAVAMASNESAVTPRDLIGFADGINHAIPTHEELQTAFGWLSKHGLISKESKRYQLTDNGLALFEEASAKSKRIFGIWDFLNLRFSTMNSESDVDSLTAEDVDAA